MHENTHDRCAQVTGESPRAGVGRGHPSNSEKIKVQTRLIHEPIPESLTDETPASVLNTPVTWGGIAIWADQLGGVVTGFAQHIRWTMHHHHLGGVSTDVLARVRNSVQ